MAHAQNTITLLAAAAALLVAPGLGAQDGDTVYRAHLFHDRE
ncbi:MAG: hypothetical protein V3U11_09060 [Planctomycetota bacterium]